MNSILVAISLTHWNRYRSFSRELSGGFYNQTRRISVTHQTQSHSPVDFREICLSFSLCSSFCFLFLFFPFSFLSITLFPSKWWSLFNHHLVRVFIPQYIHHLLTTSCLLCTKHAFAGSLWLPLTGFYFKSTSVVRLEGYSLLRLKDSDNIMTALWWNI